MGNIYGITVEDVLSGNFDSLGNDLSTPDWLNSYSDENEALADASMDLHLANTEVIELESVALALEAAKKIKVAQKKPSKKSKKKKIVKEGVSYEVDGDIEVGMEGVDWEYEDAEIASIVAYEDGVGAKIKEGLGKLWAAIVKFIESCINFLSGGGFRGNQKLAQDALAKAKSGKITHKALTLKIGPTNLANAVSQWGSIAFANDEKIQEAVSKSVQVFAAAKTPAEAEGIVKNTEELIAAKLESISKAKGGKEGVPATAMSENSLVIGDVEKAAVIIQQIGPKLDVAMKKKKDLIKNSKKGLVESNNESITKYASRLLRALQKDVTVTWKEYRLISSAALTILRAVMGGKVDTPKG